MFKKISPKSISSLNGFRKISINSKQIGIIGAPFSDGQPKKGTELGPEVMRENGLIKILKENKFKIKDYGDLNFEKTSKILKNTHSKIKNLSSFLSAVKQLSDQVHRMTKENDVCLTIGGDHSLGFGTIHGHRRTTNKLGVLWIDAHADINSVQSTISGNAHGKICIRNKILNLIRVFN